MTVPLRSLPEMDAAEIIGTVRTMQDAVEIFRLMKDRLGLTNEFIDTVGGLTKGHADKILGRSEQKRLGYDTFALFAELFAVEFRVYINMDAVKRMETVWDERAPRWFPNAKPGRISKKLLEAAKPHVLKDFSARGGLKRAASLPARLRTKMSRKGGKSRMKKVTKAERSAMMKKGWETRRANLVARATARALEAGTLGAEGNTGSALVPAVIAAHVAE